VKRRDLLTMAFVLAALSGCATVPPPMAAPDLMARRYAGRMAVKVEGDEARSFTAGFDLEGTDQRGWLALVSPLGTQVGRAVWQPGSVVWQSADGDRRFETLDALSQELLGDVLPLGALLDWMAGRPWSGESSRPLTDTTASGFRQLGWDVQTGRVREGLIVAQRRLPVPMVTVRIKLDAP
jgi:outer membrane lipoprotein LolB